MRMSMLGNLQQQPHIAYSATFDAFVHQWLAISNDLQQLSSPVVNINVTWYMHACRLLCA